MANYIAAALVQIQTFCRTPPTYARRGWCIYAGVISVKTAGNFRLSSKQISHNISLRDSQKIVILKSTFLGETSRKLRSKQIRIWIVGWIWLWQWTYRRTRFTADVFPSWMAFFTKYYFYAFLGKLYSNAW